MTKTVHVRRVITVDYAYPLTEEYCGENMTEESLLEYEASLSELNVLGWADSRSEVVTVEIRED